MKKKYIIRNDADGEVFDELVELEDHEAKLIERIFHIASCPYSYLDIIEVESE